ncbi:hypothetical protein CSC94_05980 [Zhengella mangrovi]|uniref:HTH cro/C1-type domain-containing protein n=1 Tax=Zhengella mangrovi TaxID=1982044 RepID=A0A2G1QRT1_9HYPH|nr:hypothetical protein CSC94_05980 [Zhengella mangrovi]
MVAEVDFVKFSRMVLAALGDTSLRDAAARSSGLNAGMLSRATNGKRLSVSSYLAICKALGIGPFEAFYMRPGQPEKPAGKVGDIVERLKRNQAVTACVARETAGDAG